MEVILELGMNLIGVAGSVLTAFSHDEEVKVNTVFFLIFHCFYTT